MKAMRILAGWVISGLILIGGVGCSGKQTAEADGGETPAVEEKADTLIFKSYRYIDGDSLLILRMNPEICAVAMADSVIPNIKDSSIALCVEAAFTGELLDKFKSTNVAGDYVVEGRLRKGYKCKANTGFLATVNGRPFISSVKSLSGWLKGKHTPDYCMFQQALLIHDGRDVYAGKPIKPGSRNIYRAACIMKDGNFAVIQSVKPLPLGKFISGLIKAGVSDALYLDMGTGWNYGWYRETPESRPVKLFNIRTIYQTNWLVIKKRQV